jgi:hypothetical protein
MGQTVLPIVEESSPQLDEPPICGLNEPHNAHQQRQLQPNSVAGGAPPTLDAPHTLSFKEVAEKLQVDVKYAHAVLHSCHKALTFAAMDSAMTKWNVASNSMDLTRLRELKGYPCGKFS